MTDLTPEELDRIDALQDKQDACLSGEQLDALVALAEAATPGPWKWDERLITCADDFTDVLEVETGKQVACGCDEPDAAFIAALDPPTVRRLVQGYRLGVLHGEQFVRETARADAAEARAEREQKLRIRLTTQVGGLQARAAELEAERDVWKRHCEAEQESADRLAHERTTATNRYTALADAVKRLAEWKQGEPSAVLKSDLRGLLDGDQ